jgi:uncharacterized protein with beta-barrel porin domain
LIARYSNHTAGAFVRTITLYSTVSAVAIIAASMTQSAHAQTQTIATPLNANAINLLSPLSTLSNTPTISQNLTTAIAINNNATTAQQSQALIDNTITTDNGVVLSDGLGPRLNAIWRANNSSSGNGAFSTNLLTLFRQINAISQDDSGKAKNFLADGSANGTVFINSNNLALGRTATSNTPVTGVTLPAGGVFNIYDKSYAPIANPNKTGDSRPIQVAPNSIVRFNGLSFGGVPTSSTAIIGGVNGNAGSGLFANASLPSGHTTFGYTTSILFGMLVPERFQQMMTRGSEYGDSRIVLGAHYPLDVIAGRALASYDVAQMLNNNPRYLGATVNGVFGIGDLTTTSNFQTVFTAAQSDVRSLLTTNCGTDIATCATTGAPDRFSNAAANQANYIARLTYGLPTLSFAQAPREAAPAGGPDASILLATVYGGDSAAAKTIAPNGGLLGSLTTTTINQIIVNTETNALAGLYGTALSYWSRLDLYSAYGYFQNLTGSLTLASTDRVTTTVTIANGGTLAGTGTVGSTVIASGGALQPGAAAPGMLSVNGSLAFQSGALYVVQTNSTATSSVQVSGTAALAGAVQVVSPTNTYAFNKPTTILTSANLNGSRFSSVAAPTGVTGALAYTGNAVQLSLTSTLGQIAGLNGNQQAVGRALDAAFNAGGSSAGLGSIFAGNATQNLSQASGETATGTQQATVNAMTQFMGVIADPTINGRDGVAQPGGSASSFAEADEVSSYASTGRKRSKAEMDARAMVAKAPPLYPYEPRWSTWAAGFGGSQTTDGNAGVGSNATTSRLYGVAAGADYRFSPSTIAGFALAGGSTNYGIGNAGTGRSDLFQAGAFLRQEIGQAYLSGALAYGWQDITTDRTLTIAGVDQLRARFNANAYSGRIESGYRFVMPGSDIGITPYAAGQFTTFALPGYGETAVGGLNTFALNYAATNVTASRSELGLRSDKTFALADSLFVLRGRAAWAHNFNTERAATATFQTLPLASFVVNGAAPAADAALVSASAELKYRNGLSLGATFEGEFSTVTRGYAGKGFVRYAW